MKLLVKKTNSGLKPMYDSDYEVYSKIPLGEEFEIDYKKARNLKFHKKFFALIKLAFENQEQYRLLDELREDLTIQAGYYYEHTNFITGEIKMRAKSISFSSMDNTEFTKLYDGVKTVIIEWLKITDEDIKENIEQFF